MSRHLKTFAATALAACLTACGGGGGSSTTTIEGTPEALPALVAPDCTIDQMVEVLAPTVAHTTLAGTQDRGRLARLDNGNIVLTWAADDQDGDEYGVYMRIFQPDGTPVTGELLVNQHTTDDQDNPSVTVLAGGAFVVSWTNGPFSWESRPAPDGDGTSVWARIFSADGTPQGNEFQVNDSTVHDQRNSTLLALPDGGFVCVYRVGRGIQTSPGAFGEDGFLAFKRYAADGSQLLAETVIADSDTIGTIRLRAEPDSPHAAMLDGNRFVVVWHFDQLHRPDADRVGPPYPKIIRGRIVNAGGSMETPIFTVSQHPTDRDTTEIFPRVARAPGGGFSVAWQSTRVGRRSVRVRHYDRQAIARGDEQEVVPFGADDPRPIDAHCIVPVPDFGFLVGGVLRATGASDTLILQMVDANGVAAGAARESAMESGSLFGDSGLDAVRLANGSYAVAYSVDPTTPGDLRDVMLTILGCP